MDPTSVVSTLDALASLARQQSSKSLNEYWEESEEETTSTSQYGLIPIYDPIERGLKAEIEYINSSTQYIQC